MVSLLQRMRKMQTLLAIRLGPGAALLPKDVSRIHLRFGQKVDGGHMGPRKFWRHELVRLKYHNPAVSMTVDRTAPPTEPALMTIHFTPEDATQTSSSPTSAPNATSSTSGDKEPSAYTPTVRTESFDMTNRTSSEILAEFMALTKARPVEATPEEQETLLLLREQKARSERDSKMSLEVRERKKREEALLAQARGDLSAAAV